MFDRAIRLLVPLVVFSLVFAAHAAQAAPLGNEFQINTFTTGSQYTSREIASDANGNFVVIWASSFQEGDSSNGVFGQLYSSAGAAAGSEFRINTYTIGEQRFAAVASTSNGDFVVVWQSSGGQDGYGYGVFGQRYNSAGTAAGSEFQINSYTTGTQFRPAVATDANGAFVVVWQSGHDGGGSDGVFGRRFSSSGAPMGSEFQINSYTTNQQQRPAVAAEPDGDFTVVWRSNGQDGDSYGVFGRRYSSSGMAAGGEFQINTYTTGAQNLPAVASDTGGDFVVVWQSSGGQDGAGYGVFGRRFNSAGSAAGSEFQVNSYTTSDQRNTAATALTDGDFVIVWESNTQDSSIGGIFGRRYSSAGTAVGSEFQINTYTTGQQVNPGVAAGADGNYVVAWTSVQDGSSFGVFGQRFGNTPTPTPTPTDTPADTPTTTPTQTPTQTPTITPTSAAAECAPTPLTCATPGKTLVKIKNTGDATKSQILWKWLKGTVGSGDFGDPTATTNYRLCFYEGMTPLAAPQPAIESGTSWTAAGSGFKYGQSGGNADGVFKMLVKHGTGNAKILIKAKGSNTGVPMLPLTPSPYLRVQLVKNPGSGGECWESTFSSPFTKDDALQFKDKEP